jgi:hypothetical protein
MYGFNKCPCVDQMAFVCRTENSELVSKFHFALHVFHAALPALSKLCHNAHLYFQKTVLKKVSKCRSHSHFSPLLHTQIFDFPPPYLIHLSSSLPYLKDERALPGIFKTHTFPPCNKLTASDDIPTSSLHLCYALKG